MGEMRNSVRCIRSDPEFRMPGMPSRTDLGLATSLPSLTAHKRIAGEWRCPHLTKNLRSE